jgi:hypothetical protein
MKRLYFCLVFILALGLVIPAYAGQGNALPSGPHFNLNIIGVQHSKKAGDEVTGLTKGNGHRIFVPLTGNCKIMLTEGPFAVADYNCTDGIAQFYLPNPDPNNDGVTDYSVFARGLGGGGHATMQTCAYDDFGNLFCSTNPGGTPYILTIEPKKNGDNKFENVSRYLLYIYADIGDGYHRYPLFDDDLQDYFWDYNNFGLKLAQFRFYEVPTNVDP